MTQDYGGIGYGQIRKFIEDFEGNHKKVYKCPAGKLTIGIGCNLERRTMGKILQSLELDYKRVLKGEVELTAIQVDALFRLDLTTAIQTAQSSVANFWAHPEPVRMVIVDMCFNLGMTRFRKFKKMILALEKRDYKTAAAEMKDSDWYHQVGNRSKRNVTIVDHAATL